MIKKWLLLIILIMITPLSSAFSFEKNYYTIIEDSELNNSINKIKIDEFNSIEYKVFNNHLCNKYYVRSYNGSLRINVPIEITIENISSNSNVVFSYPGAFHLYLYACDGTNIFNFKFKSEEIDNSEFSSRFAAYKPEYVYFNGNPINDFINNNLKRDINDYKENTLDRNSNLFEFIMINKSDFTYTDNFCKTIGYYLINEFHPATFSESHNDYLCKMGAYSLLKNHFLFTNEIQGFFISDYHYTENYNFESALESILIRKLAEKSIYRKYYNRYQTKDTLDSLYLSLLKPYDKSELYDLQSKNVNLQIPELLDLLSYIDNQLRVSKYNELAITRIDRKNEMLNWLAIIFTFIVGIASPSLIKKIPYSITFEKWYKIKISRKNVESIKDAQTITKNKKSKK